MRYTSRQMGEGAKVDRTPMIDMTFLLIAFFMVVVSFSEADQNERITLPLSELAKPPDAPLETPITLHLTDAGTVLIGAKEVDVVQLAKELSLERQLLEARGDESAQKATIIIRADRAAKTGEVQEVIEVCQKTGFDKFALRAKQESS